MKTHHLSPAGLCMITLMLASCNPNPVGPGNLPLYVPSDSARTYFLLDATDFAVEYLTSAQSPDTASIRVPDAIVNRYLYPLCALYDKRGEFPILDSLLFTLQIHKQSVTSKSLWVEADTMYAWARNVGRGIFPTGDRTVDSLAETYRLTFRPSYGWGYGGFGWFTTDQPPLNTRALGRAFLSVPGVVLTGPNAYWNFQTALTLTVTDSVSVVTFAEGLAMTAGPSR
jgi:hypothetical protein